MVSNQRLTSVGFAYANTRVELGVKTAKMLQGDNMSSIGKLDNMAVTKALLMYRNSPDRDTGQYHAYLLLGCHLRDILPSKPALGIASDLSSTWLEVAEYRELALDKRSAKAQEMNHIKEHAPLELGDNVMVQN